MQKTGEARTEMGRKKIKKGWPVFWIILGVLAAEIFIFNFSAWKSLFYKERAGFEQIGVEGGDETTEGSR